MDKFQIKFKPLPTNYSVPDISDEVSNEIYWVAHIQYGVHGKKSEGAYASATLVMPQNIVELFMKEASNATVSYGSSSVEGYLSYKDETVVEDLVFKNLGVPYNDFIKVIRSAPDTLPFAFETAGLHDWHKKAESNFSKIVKEKVKNHEFDNLISLPVMGDDDEPITH